MGNIKEPLIDAIVREQQHNSSALSGRGVRVMDNAAIFHSPRPEGPLLMWKIAD